MTVSSLSCSVIGPSKVVFAVDNGAQNNFIPRLRGLSTPKHQHDNMSHHHTT